MTSEDAGLVPTQRIDHGLNSSLVFHDRSHRFNCGASQRRAGDPDLKTRELGGFIDGRYFKPHVEEFRPSMYAEAGRDRRDHENWNGNGRASSGDDSEGDDDDEDDDDEDEDDEVDGEVEGLGGAAKIDNGKAKHLSSFVGSSREAMMKDGSIVQSGNENNNARTSPSEDHQHGRLSQYQNAVSVADPEGNLYFSRYLQGPGGSSTGQKDTLFENGSGFSGRKDSLFSNEHGVSLRAILSDPLTGALMDDAVILPCGHSFGAGGIQHVIRMKACYTCSQAVSENSVAPNLSLQAAIQAFRREEELHVYRASKRRRERFEQEKGTYGDSTLEDHPRSRGVQFPFAVTDRVIIKGNKRTPQRFVGRQAVVTTQCLNGWYVVKTLDNAESVKLQYRSLAKVSDDSSAKPMSDKMTPNWL